MDTTLMLVIELLGGVVLLFVAGWIFARVTGYDKYYDNMVYNNVDDFITENNNDNRDDIIHHVYI